MAKDPGASWDATRKQQYRRQHQDQVCTWHFVLDASPSMIGKPAENLRRAYEIYLGWLQVHADPMSLIEVVTFSTEMTRYPIKPLGQCVPLTDQEYDPRLGSGTALYNAVGKVCTAPNGVGQHILVTFTDGEDTTAAYPRRESWKAETVKNVLTTLQDQDHWCAVFLGAFPQALEVGKTMGFPAGNCLVFPNDTIPEAFMALTRATERYLLATPEERKLLAVGGIF